MSTTEAEARRSLLVACRNSSLPAEPLELIRIGTNAVFRINSTIIARVAPDLSFQSNAEKQIAVARWLERVNYPAVRAMPITQPVHGDDHVVTFWQSVAAKTAYAPIADVANLIKSLHSLTAPADLMLPPLRPFGEVGDDLPGFTGLSDTDRNFMYERIRWARTTFQSLSYVLPKGVVHGDANVGNVLCDDDGNAVLIDLDSFAIGPREWDLVQTALFYDRLGWHTREEYQTFVDVYGYDLTQWEDYEALADMREIAMTTWLSEKATTSPAAAAEAAKRINAIRSGTSRRDWGAY